MSGTIRALDEDGEIEWFCPHGVPDSEFCGRCEAETEGTCAGCGAYLQYYEPCFCHLGPTVVALAREMDAVEWRWMLTASVLANREQEARDRAYCAAHGFDYDERFVPFD